MVFSLPASWPETLASALIAFAVPLLLAGVGECITERAGVLNVGLEGTMLAAALAAVGVSSLTVSAWWGLAAGLSAALVMGALMAWMTVDRRASQVVTGTAINLFSLGLTGAVFGVVSAHLAARGMTALAGVKLPDWPIPLLSGLPTIGAVAFGSNVLAYTAFLAPAAAAFLLYRTRYGLQLRAAGEFPHAVEAAGGSVRALRWAAVLIGSGMAGLAGCYLSIGHVASFQENMVAGKGFIALGLVIFGRWSPWGVALGALVFSGAWGLATALSAQGRGRPEEVGLLALPYAATLLVLLIRRDRAALGGPAALGVPLP